MIKQYYRVLFVLLFIALDCNASIWSAIGACASNPCNCGYDTIDEHWNGATQRTVKPEPLCPPYNKWRDDGTCLMQFDYPGSAIAYYKKCCAEYTSESSYFTPKIRVRYQACNAGACWTNSTTLNWEGECVVWPGAYAADMLRICARVAVPAMPAINGADPIPADPGYVYGKHLNWQGVEVDDPKPIGSNGSPTVMDKPKLCAYKDPSLYDVVTGTIDLMDFKPEKQPIHNTGGVHPIVKVIMFLVQMISGTAQTLGDLLGPLFDKVFNAITVELGWGGSNNKVFKAIFDFIGLVIKYIGEGLLTALREIGQFNRVVNESLGCVEIPTGPFPPPYCSAISPYSPPPTTQAVCATGGSISPEDTSVPAWPIVSTSDNKCVVSQLVNNFIRNTVRITVDNFVPLCSPGQDPQQTDTCVLLSNMSGLSSARSLHVATAYRDLIRPCSALPSGSNSPCVNTMISSPRCNASQDTWCSSDFRVVYGSRTGQITTASGYFANDLPDCTGISIDTCQIIWGVNTGSFIDVSLIFPQVETSYTVNPLTKNFSVYDMNGNSKQLSASIVRQPLQQSQFQQTPSQICVFDTNSVLIGCEQRSPMQLTQQDNKSCIDNSGSIVRCSGNASQTLIYGCDNSIVSALGLACTNDFFLPRLVTRLRSGTDSTAGVIQALSINNSTQSSYKRNLAGYDFAATVTDTNFTRQPFSGSHSIDKASIYGTYKVGPQDNIAAPYVGGNPPVMKDGVYLYGLEYMNNKYIQGGNYVCLDTTNIVPCGTSNTKNCVLTRLQNASVVPCSSFFTKMALYQNLQSCNSSYTNCSNVDSISSVIQIKRCDNNVYCYTGSQQICQVTNATSDRYDPSSSLGDVLQSNQYYQITDSNGNTRVYDKDLYALRTKTPVELGLCVPVPQPSCNAITTPDVSSGGAMWAAATYGTQSTGSCPPGKSSAVPLLRYCLSDAQNMTVRFEDIPIDSKTNTTKVLCKPNTITFTMNNSNNFPSSYRARVADGRYEFGDKTADSLQFHGTGVYKPSGSWDYMWGDYGSRVYTSTLTFNIDDVSLLQSITLAEVSYKDYIAVLLNDQPILIGPNIFTQTLALDNSSFTNDVIDAIANGTDFSNQYYNLASYYDSSAPCRYSQYALCGFGTDAGTTDSSISLITLPNRSVAQLRNGQNTLKFILRAFSPRSDGGFSYYDPASASYFWHISYVVSAGSKLYYRIEYQFKQ